MASTDVTTAEGQAPDAPKGEQARAFLEGVRQELQKVSWPTREELLKATRAVVLASLALGLAIGVLDFVLGKILVDGVAALAR